MTKGMTIGATIVELAKERGEEGVTTRYIVEKTGFKYQTVSKEKTNLKKKGLLIPHPTEKKEPRGKDSNEQEILVHPDYDTTPEERLAKLKKRFENKD